MSRDWRWDLDGWPTAENDYNRAEHCAYCNATGERLEPIGQGELVCYLCVTKPERRPAAEPAQGVLL